MNLLKKIIHYRLDKNFLNRYTMAGLKAAAGRQRYIRVENPPPGVAANHEIVILIHGLLHRGMVMNSFASFLAKQGYTAVIYDYPTTRYDFFRHAEDFRIFLNRIAEQFPGYKINNPLNGRNSGTNCTKSREKTSSARTVQPHRNARSAASRFGKRTQNYGDLSRRSQSSGQTAARLKRRCQFTDP